jgi:hypothetical protein
MDNSISEHTENLRAMKDALRDIQRDPDLGPTLTPEVWARVLSSGALIVHAHGNGEGEFEDGGCFPCGLG